jgi:hypothetical protein
MSRRTQPMDYVRIEAAEDVELLVKDKREVHRANKQEKHRRHRHYVRTMLRHMADAPPDYDETGEEG